MAPPLPSAPCVLLTPRMCLFNIHNTDTAMHIAGGWTRVRQGTGLLEQPETEQKKLLHGISTPHRVRLAQAPSLAKRAISPPMLPEFLILLLRNQKKRSVQMGVEKKNPGSFLPKKSRAFLNSGSDTEKPCL